MMVTSFGRAEREDVKANVGGMIGARCLAYRDWVSDVGDKVDVLYIEGSSTARPRSIYLSVVCTSITSHARACYIAERDSMVVSFNNNAAFQVVFLSTDGDVTIRHDFMFTTDDMVDDGCGISCDNYAWDTIIDRIAAFNHEQVCPIPACTNMFLPTYESVCSSCAPFLTKEGREKKECVVCLADGFLNAGMVRCHTCKSGLVCAPCFGKMKVVQRRPLPVVSCPLCRGKIGDAIEEDDEDED